MTKDQLEVLAYYDSLGDVRGRAVKTAQHFGINRSTVYTYLQRREAPQPPPQQNNAAPVNIADVLRERPRTLAELTEVLDMSPSQVRAMLVETPGVQRDGDAFSIPSVAKSDDIIAALRKTPLTLTEIAARLKMPESEASRLCAALKMQGINIHTFGDKYSVEPAPQMGNHANDNRYRLVANKNGYFKFGVTSDNHLCSKYYRDDVLQKLYDNFAEAGISHVYNAGNWIDGEARFNKFELLVHGMNQQIEYFLEHYPQRTGINTYFIAGDDHEGWYCFDNETEILTKHRGWVPFTSLESGDAVATRTNDGVFEWQQPRKIVEYKHKGSMIRFKSRSLDFSVTPDHRLLCMVKPSLHGEAEERVLTAQQILDGFKSRCIAIVCASKGWEGQLTPCVDIPRVESKRYAVHPHIQHFGQQSVYDVAELIGWYVTEGSTHKGVVSIAQSREKNPENYQRICNLFDRMGVRYSLGASGIRVCSPELASYLEKECGSGSYYKFLPAWVKDQPSSVLKNLFDAMIEGDGSKKTFSYRFYSWSKKLRDDMSEIAQKLGFAVVESEKHNALSIRALHRDQWLVSPPTVEEYEGQVHCVNVPNERIYVRARGKAFWSMNCQREGVDIGLYTEMKAIHCGRNDLKYLGYIESYVDLVHPSTNRSSKLLVCHPGGGSSYAISYTSQKSVEAYDGGEKPAVALYGHYHKLNYSYIRNVHAIQTGCTQDQSSFMRKKKIAAHLGGVIVEGWLDENGAVTRCKTEFLTFFDRGYYQNQWNLASGIKQHSI